MPVIDALPRPELLGQVPPRRPGPIPPGDRFEHLAMVTPPPAPTWGPVGQQRLEPRPHLVGDHRATHIKILSEPIPMIHQTRSSRPDRGRGPRARAPRRDAAAR